MATEVKDKAELGTNPALARDREMAQKTSANRMPNIPGAYIRIKWIRGKPYYYLVKGYREGEKIRQKVLRYYGLRPPRKRSAGGS